jgi:hypothetical protein
MKLYTSVDIAPSARQIGYGDKILLLGSCFADNIGTKFSEYYFQAAINPLGTLYNPASIAIAVADMGNRMSDIRLVEHNGLWHSMMHHGTFSGKDKTAVKTTCMDGYERLQRALKEATIVIVTFGTAWVYEMDGQVVANCHKLPANRFTRRCLTVDEIVEMWQPIVGSMPEKHWIFTVSPIRHVKDGLHANQVSKAILLQAVDELRQSYFPSYEIMMDELRDYRFYAEDMVHPSSLAVEYIWNRFLDTYMSDNTREQMRVLHQLWRDRQHRFLHPESQEARAFQQHLSQRLTTLKQVYPWLE